MNLPTKDQVAAATRHVGTAATLAIGLLGLATKINPDQVVAAINSLGTLVNDVLILIGIVGPIYAGWKASHSAAPAQQIAAVAANPDVVKVVTTSQVASDSPSAKVVTR